MTKRKLLAHEQLFMKSHIKHGKYQRLIITMRETYDKTFNR